MRPSARRSFGPVVRALLPALALLVSLAACRQTAPAGRRDAAGPPGAAGAVRTVVDARAWLQDDTLPEALEPLPGDADEPPLVVLERGSAARALRLEPAVGTRQTLAVRLEQSVDDALDGVSRRTDFIARLRLELAVAERTTDGGARGTLGLTSVTLEREPSTAEPATAVREAVAGLAGTTARVQLGPLGDFVQVAWELPDGWSAEVEQAARMITDAVELLTVPLPAEPVGSGGRWGREFRSSADAGLDATTRERFLLETLDGDRGRLRARTRTRAGEQQLRAPADAADVQVRLLELDLQDSAELLFDLGRPLPVQGRRALISIQRRRRTVADRTELLETRTRTLLEMEPAGEG